jgi:SAM-dependent methyltransferase
MLSSLKNDRLRQCFYRFGPRARVLDVGCGVGHLTSVMADYAPQGLVLGVDNWSKGVTQATARFPPRLYPNLRFRMADARRLDLEEPPFDFAVSRDCLNALRHPGEAFLAIAKNLKVGGSMHLWFAGNGYAESVDRTLRRMIQLPEWREFFREFRPPRAFVTPASCEPWLSVARMRTDFCALVEDEVVFPSYGIFFQWVRWTWHCYWEHLPGRLRSDLSESFCRFFRPVREDEVRIRLVWLALDATKK